MHSDSRPPPKLHQWLPDETLFSLASRCHRVSCNALPAQTCQQLFGHVRQGSAHDLPSRLTEFVTRTRGMLGDERQIACEHTLLSFYFPYRSPFESDNALATVCRGGLGSLKGRLGILASRMGAEHPLKTCPKCMAEDAEKYNVAYWHLEHQWPGAWVCRQHGSSLQFALYKTNGEGRFHWCLPMDVVHAPGIDARKFDKAQDCAERLTDCALGVPALGMGFHFDPMLLATVYQQRLIELDCAGANGRLKSKELSQRLQGVCTPLSQLRGLGALGGSEASILSQFTRLVGEHRGIAHPIKHFVLVIALFGDWTTFVAAYKQQRSMPSTHGDARNIAAPNAGETPSSDKREPLLVAAVKGGMSVTAAATTFEVAVATAMAWAASAGLRTPRRAKIFVTALKDRAIRLLRKGASKEEAALAVSVSIQTVTLLLRTEPGLRLAWNQAKFNRAQCSARTSWARTAGQLQPATPQALRQLQPAVFAWLYRNDRAWLDNFSTNLSKAPRSNQATVRWDVRDCALAQAVRVAALEIHDSHPHIRPRRSELCDKVPNLKARLSDLSQLPLTRAAIAEATRRSGSGLSAQRASDVMSDRERS